MTLKRGHAVAAIIYRPALTAQLVHETGWQEFSRFHKQVTLVMFNSLFSPGSADSQALQYIESFKRASYLQDQSAVLEGYVDHTCLPEVDHSSERCSAQNIATVT